MTGDRVGGTVGGTVLHNAKGKGRHSQNAASKRCWHYLGNLLPPIAACAFAGLPNASNYRYSPRFSCGDVQVCRLPAQCLRATHRLTPGLGQGGFRVLLCAVHRNGQVAPGRRAPQNILVSWHYCEVKLLQYKLHHCDLLRHVGSQPTQKIMVACEQNPHATSISVLLLKPYSGLAVRRSNNTAPIKPRPANAMLLGSGTNVSKRVGESLITSPV